MAALQETLSIEQFGALLVDPEGLEQPVSQGTLPLTIVELGDPRRWSDLPKLPATSPRIFVGLAETIPQGASAPQPFDILLTTATNEPNGWVRVEDVALVLKRIALTCRDAPRAATTLAQVLRVGSALSMTAALVAESFAYSMLLGSPEFVKWRTRQPQKEHRDDDEPILVSDDGETITIALNRPMVHHAYDARMRDALVDTLRAIVAIPDPPRVVLRSEGPTFCSGGDLSEFGQTSDPATAHGIRTSRAPGLLLHALGHRARANVQGACIGAGIELPAFCGRVIASPDATFCLPEVRMGLIPGAGGTVSIPARIGRQRTAYLALTGDRVGATVALRWGLVDAIINPDETARG